ncbi:MAG: hypothetical protein H6741_22425 [Alphaproteobacteria bacterium]|nr:hypothetical protein [Alphaproteobacteria bacterium]
MIWLLLACVSRPPPAEIPAEAVVEAGVFRVTLRCAEDPGCPGRAEAAAAALESGDWAGAAQAAGPGEFELREADEIGVLGLLVAGGWPVEIPHPALPEGQRLAAFELVDGAMALKRGDGAVTVGVAGDRAAAEAALSGGPGWSLRCEANGFATELGDGGPWLRGLSLTP